MATLRTATSAYRKKVEAFKRASVGKVKDGTEIDLVAGGRVLLQLNLERWDGLEKVYNKLCDTYPDPEEEVEVPDEYAFREELLDRGQASYDLVNTAISKRIGNLLEAVVDVMPAG